MLVLALDTAMSACSVALCSNGGTLAVRSQAMERGHAEALMPMIERVMAEGGRAYAELDLVAATVGPGAFTGIRVGLAAARGIALAAGKPCAGVTTLEVLAAAARIARPGAVLAVVESRRADLFVQAFDASGAGVGAACALPPEGLPEFVRECGLSPGFALAGDGAARARAALAEAGIAATAIDGATMPDPARIAAIAAARHGQASALAPRPLYIRPPDVTYPKEV
jgi:tRNA threonylcarbamoyladenosine biosynthesis protein TsaB